MTIAENRYFVEGRGLMACYHSIKSSCDGLFPKEKHYKVMSKQLDLNTAWIKKCINAFLYN